ncbi:MAG: ATP-dependent helicase [Bacillota bacterium]
MTGCSLYRKEMINMIELRPGQDRVAEFRDGFLAVPAVPGAGKTTVLAYLTAKLIENNYTEQKKILIVTYMKSAVANFRRRIGNFLEERGLPRNRGYEVRTLHSLALNILREGPQDLLISDDFEIADPAVQGTLLREVIEEWIVDNTETFLQHFTYNSDSPGYNRALERWKEDDFPRFVKSMISRFKVRGLTRSDIEDLQRKSSRYSYLDWVFTIYKKYDRMMNRQGYLDFDDLINQAYNLLAKNEKLCLRLRDKYSFVFEDEAQDSNALLEKILFSLAGESGNLVRVGDSNQAIMGTFTAADPRVFRNYINHKKVRTEAILYSSRSTKEIIDLANYLVKWTVNNHPQSECRTALEEKYIQPVPEGDDYPNPVTEGYTVAGHVFADSEAEIAHVARAAAQHATENPDNTLAVLVPANYIIESIAEKLEEYDVQYHSVQNRAAEQLAMVENFINLISYLAEPYRDQLLKDVLREILLPELSSTDSEEEEFVFLDRLFKEFSPDEIIYKDDEHYVWDYLVDSGVINSSQEQILVQALQRVQLWLEASVKLPPDELILLIAEQLDLGQDELAIAQNIALEVGQELNTNPHWKLYEIAAELTIMEESFRRFAREIYSRQGYEPEPGVVNLTTVHRAKGLEWDTVYLIFLTDDNYPSTLDSRFRAEHYYLEDEFSNPSALARTRLDDLMGLKTGQNPRREAKIESISERLRLLYVGITRAQKNLLLSAHREMIYDNGNSRDVEQSQAFRALKKFIAEKRENYGE